MHAQKTIFKKDQYQVDKETVATVEEKRSVNVVNKNFTILDNNKQELVRMEIKNLALPQGFSTPTWYEVTFVPENKTVTRPLSEKVLGARKELLEEFAELNVIGKGGLQPEGVKAYSDRYHLDLNVVNKAVADSVKDLVSRSTHIVDRDKSARIRVGYDKTIKQGGVQLGTWEKYGDKSNFKYIIKNDIGGIVGIISYVSGFNSVNGMDIYAFFGGDEHTHSGKEAGISPDDKDTEVVEKFVRYMMSRNNM